MASQCWKFLSNLQKGSDILSCTDLTSFYNCFDVIIAAIYKKNYVCTIKNKIMFAKLKKYICLHNFVKNRQIELTD